ncbi:MAG: amidohydrolase [Clostridia bacterium]|nr:amidohydrolase [Clostridia bacterium]
MMKTLFKNCKILVRDNGVYRVLDNAVLGVDGAVIDYIGAEMPDGAYDAVKDYAGKLLMPGLYNCHTHSPMVLLRGIGNDKPLHTWLNEYIFPIERTLTATQIKTASALAIMEMLASGTVSFTDMYFFSEQTAEAVFESGIKANLTKQIQFANEKSKVLNESLAFVKEWNGKANDRVHADFSVHSCYTCDFDTVVKYSTLCRENGGRMHLHLSETQKEFDDCLRQSGMTPTQWFLKAGALGKKTTAAHCVVLTEEDRAILAETGANVAHCPTSNLKLGSGFAPIPELLEKGVNVTLGTDGAASNNNLNLFEEMHLAAIVHNGRLKDTTLMDTDTVIDMATVNGAKAQGRENCGELKVGFKADLIALDINKPHFWGNAANKSLITYSAQGSDVFMTMVDGKILYENGEYLTLDKEKILYETNELLH